jgi:hypothetical protein
LLRTVLALLVWGLLAWVPGTQAASLSLGAAAWMDGSSQANGPFLSQGSARFDTQTTNCGVGVALGADARDPCSQSSAEQPAPLDLDPEQQCDHVLPPTGLASHEAEPLPWPVVPTAAFAVAPQDGLLRPPDLA